VQLDGSTVAYISETENDRDNEFFERRIRTKGGSFASAISWSRKKIRSLTNRNKARGNSLISRLTNGLATSTFVDFSDFLSEGPLSPIPKTDKPNLFHGNYGGKGNRGGEPVDKLDQAFQKHDTGYHYTPDSKKRLKHDKSLVKATSSIAKDKSQPIKTRVKAGMASALFKTKLALKKKDVKEQTITPKYTGDENSWYLDAYGNKVQVYSQADLKHPEDFGEFTKNPTRQKDVGSVMSMNDFLKTQPEKKK
jgi:hypothetical protein